MHFPSLIVNTLIAAHGAVSFTLGGCGLFATHAPPAMAFYPSAADSLSRAPRDIGFFYAAPFTSRRSPSKNTAPIPGPETQSTPADVSPSVLHSYQLLQDERLSIRQPQREKTIPSPPTPLYQCAPSSHRTNPGQTAIKTSAPPAKGWVRVNHRSINLIFIHSPLAASHRWAGSGGVDCVDCHARCNYTHLCLWVALHMTGKNWAVILVILSLLKELAR